MRLRVAKKVSLGRGCNVKAARPCHRWGTIIKACLVFARGCRRGTRLATPLLPELKNWSPQDLEASFKDISHLYNNTGPYAPDSP